MTHSEITAAPRFRDLLEKGATRDSEKVYKDVKSLHKRLVTFCMPSSTQTDQDLEDCILVTENPPTAGLPPGKKRGSEVEEVLGDMWTSYLKLRNSNRTSSARAGDYHLKLVDLTRRVEIFCINQKRQEKLDSAFAMARGAAIDLINADLFRNVMAEDDHITRSKRKLSPYLVATKTAADMAGRSIGEAVLLAPGEGGWSDALAKAREVNLLQSDFPNFGDDDCLSKIAALEVRRLSVIRREGTRRVEVKEGVLRPITTVEFEELVAKRCGGDLADHLGSRLQIIPVPSLEGGKLFSASWMGIDCSAEVLLDAELVEVRAGKQASLVDCIAEMQTRWNWFSSVLVDFIQRRGKYAGKVLNFHSTYDVMVNFPRAYVRQLSQNLLDQLSDPDLRGRAGEMFDTMLRQASAGQEELLNQMEGDDFEEDSEDEDYEDVADEIDRAYLEVRQPATLPLSPPPPSASPPVLPRERPLSPLAPPLAPGEQGGQGGPSRAPLTRTRPVSGGSAGSEEGLGLGSVPPTTASQVRGDGKTHTLALQMIRARQVLESLDAHPDSSRYRNQRSKVAKMLEEAERHLREDDDVSTSYEDFLGGEMTTTEEACALKDEECDRASREKKLEEDEKKNLLAALPRGLGQKFSGKAQDWPAFKKTFESIMKTVDPSLAVKHMIALIADPALQKRLQIYTSGEAIIKELDKDLGHSFLTCQVIVNEISRKEKAKTKKEENALICAFKHAKRTLDQQADYHTLLNISTLLTWGDLLLPNTYTKILEMADESEFGKKYDLVEPFFQYLERVYSMNGADIRHQESLAPPPKDKGTGKKRGKVGFTDSRAFSAAEVEAGCGYLCDKGEVHPPHNCPQLSAGKVKVADIKKAGLCTCCIATKDKCQKGEMKRKDGSTFAIACPKCKISKRVLCHKKCKTSDQKGSGSHNSGAQQGGGRVDEPPVPVAGGGAAPADATVQHKYSATMLRTEFAALANPLKLGSACELLDYVQLQAPDGSTLCVRAFFDSGGTDSMLDYRLSRFFHHYVPATVGINGSNACRALQSHVGDLKILLPNGNHVFIKAVKNDLSGEAWTIKRKFVDVPEPLHHHFAGTIQYPNEVGDLRVPNATENYQVSLVIGLDVCTLFPAEVARWSDQHGQLVLHRSVLSNRVIVSGARKTGSAAPRANLESDLRTYLIAEENEVVQLRRAECLPADTRDLFVKRKNLTKIEQKMFQHFEDNDQLVPPQTDLCQSCQGCQICSDPFKARRVKTVIRLMDQLVTYKDAPREEKGGYHIKLLYDTDQLPKVAEGRQAALKRLLATEKQLIKPGMESARQYFNEKVQRCRDKGYLLTLDQAEGLGLEGLQKAYMPYSFALKDEENLEAIRKLDTGPGKERQGEGLPGSGKTKARPVVDCSAAVPGFISLNQAQYKLPDVHTWRLTEILLKLRTARHFSLGDLKEFYWQLWVDSLTSSMTRVLFREGGLGSGGEIIELISPVSSMGEKQVSTFASHVRYRVSEEIKEQDPEGAEQLRGAYMDDIIPMERYSDPGLPGEVLIRRSKLIQEALAKAHLHLGDNWVSDLPQERCSHGMVGVTKDSEEVEVALGGAVQSSALGYRLHLGPNQPEGGALLWRVHRPQSLNLEPKFRGARPLWSQLTSEADIRGYLKQHGVSKASLLSLCSNLFDPLLLAAPFVSSARQLFRQVVNEVSLPSWKSQVPEVYFERITCLAEDLLQVAKKLKVPRRAVTPSPVEEERSSFPYGHATLLIICDGSMHAGVAAAYVHQQFPAASAEWSASADFSGVQVTCNLLCSALKLTEPTNQGQVEGELLAVFIGCQLKDFIVKHSLVDFHQIRICSDSLTVLKCIRKTDTAFSTWASKRIAAIQHSVDLDDTWHVPHTITDPLVDSATKPQKRPSKFLDERWFYGKGVIDIPVQHIEFTDRAVYSQPRMEDLPSQWLSSAARTLLGMKLPTVMTMRLEVEDPDLPVPSILERLAERFTDVGKAITTLQVLLRIKKGFRELPAVMQRKACVLKFVGEDYAKIKAALRKKTARLTQELALQEDEVNQVFYLVGRFHYKALLLASPKVSSWSRLVLRDAHEKNHLTATARILAKVGREYLFVSGASAYLNRLRVDCAMCRLLRPHTHSQLLGDVPPQMRGPGPDGVQAWKYQSIDIFGPWGAVAYPRARGTRGSTRKIKLFVLLAFDFSTRAIDAEICESYSADSVIMALRAVWSRTGCPEYLSFDAAANLSSAGALLGGGGDQLEQPTVAEGEFLNRQLQRRLGHQVEIKPHVAYAPWRQGAVERSVAFCKKQIVQLLHDSAGGLLTPVQATSLLSCVVAYVNERPLVIHTSPDTLGQLSPWYLSARNISATHSGILDTFQLPEDRLTERAVEAQRRLERFKKEFDIFYLKKLIKFGKWNHSDPNPKVGSTCLILDKKKEKTNFFQRFRLGRITKYLSDHVVELRYVRQDPEVTAQLLHHLRAGTWKEGYQVNSFICERDLKAVAVLALPSTEQQAPLLVDVLLGGHQRGGAEPEDLAEGVPLEGEPVLAQNVEDGEPPLVDLEIRQEEETGQAESLEGPQPAPMQETSLDGRSSAPAGQDFPQSEESTLDFPRGNVSAPVDRSIVDGDPLPGGQGGEAGGAQEVGRQPVWGPANLPSLEQRRIRGLVDWSKKASNPDSVVLSKKSTKKIPKERWTLKSD